MDRIEKKRFYNIDFLRFIFAILIALYHLTHSGKDSFFLSSYQKLPEVITLTKAMSNTYLVVDMFFIIAGFFLVYKKDFFSISLISFSELKAQKPNIEPLIESFTKNVFE